MKAENISLEERKKNAFLLRKGTDIYIKGNRLSLKDGFFWATIKAYPNFNFRITLRGAKQFLKNGKAI
ncbi:hypothetical protein [Leptospira noguchii]|uniref:hypothetical protein n=1 Tax=Leptospira noguchii TaxID=28182 RepID=UPI001FB67BAE|nr:hypothetical protein [Leptospira noguchii]UOG28980.1 hypothetical protein MAL06_09615 [Leptospira noguchii]